SFNAKGFKSGDWPSLGFFYVIHAGGTRSLPQSRPQIHKLIARAHGQHFHAAIRVVADPASDSQRVRFPLDKPAEAHPLHAPAHHETAGLNMAIFADFHLQPSRDALRPLTSTRLRRYPREWFRLR